MTPRPLLRFGLSVLARRLARARGLDVAADFDGTLSAFAPAPARARLDPAARRALRALATTPHVRVAVISGRRLADLAALVRVRGVALAGTHGVQFRDARGRRAPDRPGSPLPAGVRAALVASRKRFPPAMLETKGRSFALHVRALDARARRACVAHVRRTLAPWGARVRVYVNAGAIEVAPRGAADKGAALARWLGRPRPGRVLLVLGDDANDAPAFRAAHARGGLVAIVGRRRVRADFRAANAAGVARFLAALAPLARRALAAPAARARHPHSSRTTRRVTVRSGAVRRRK